MRSKAARRTLSAFCLLPSVFCVLPIAFSQLQTSIQNPSPPLRTPHSALRTSPAQPIPFSHKQHAREKLNCQVCHEPAGTGERAGFPSTELCMACHQQVKKESPAIRSLAEYHANKQPVPWTRIYQLPDFVFFSHAKHLRAKAACETCHGPVRTRDALWKEKETSMAACIDCHRSRKASISCNLCHEVF